MKKIITVALLLGLFTSNVLADTTTVLACKTYQGNKFTVTWNPKNGAVVVNHGNYIGTKNTNDMGWNRAKSQEAEDTEVYMDNGEVHNTISVTDTGATKVVSFKQVIGNNPDNVVVNDTCHDVIKVDLSAQFLENMIYVDDE